MDLPRYLKEKLLPILASRTMIFFFSMCVLTLFLYAAGTVQGFIDSTQLSLLKLYVILGIFLIVSAVYGMFVALGRFFKLKKRRYMLRAAIYLLFAIFGVITVLAVVFITTVAKGNMG
ncbi:MAG: hypothetical protein FWD78_17810 [Treponema sp.]|nr:hypothetical protein [Treponema sp.]